MAEDTQTAENQSQDAIFKPEKIYTKDVSFESPKSPAIFSGEWQPAVSIEMASAGIRTGEDLYEVVLHLTVTVKAGDSTAYLAEVDQAGLFTISGVTPESLEFIQQVNCPRILYPYACAAISDLISRGGFPQLLLTPINFRTLYMQRKQNGDKKQVETGNT